MTKTKEFKAHIQEFNKKYPVVQNFHTGLYGFSRVNGCVNLSLCTYKSERSAKLARALCAKYDYYEFLQRRSDAEKGIY